MAHQAGILNLDQLKASDIDTVIMAFTDCYGRLMGKRVDLTFFLSEAAEQGVSACNYLLATDMEMDTVPGYDFANWQAGYGDFHLQPDLTTLRQASWLDRSALVLCDVVSENKHSISIAPRNILQQRCLKAQELGFEVMTASELEYYAFESSYRDAFENNYQLDLLKPIGWYSEDYHLLQGMRGEPFHGELRRHLRDSGIPVETSKGEYGIGQHEMNIIYCDALMMADRHCLLKQCAKELAELTGLSVSFMAKYNDEQAGSSCHLHISLWQNGQNAFAGNEQLGPIRCSKLFKWFLAGWMKHTPELMLFYATNVNAYKRYQAGSWAPTRLVWSEDNRTAGFRIVGQDQSLRIECRIPGADVNPYLAFAAAIASGLNGIEAQLEPPAHFSGDGYTEPDLTSIPTSLNEAINLFRQSEFAKQVFGEDVVKHYAHFAKQEQIAYDKAVTDWERRRYFERI